MSVEGNFFENVSIIIPVYNAEKYLHRCIDSILKQTYQNWEAFLVNDGSTDSSLDILNSYAARDARFRIINKENGGASSARNAGLVQRHRIHMCPKDFLNGLYESPCNHHW